MVMAFGYFQNSVSAQYLVALCNLGHFYLVSKISQKLLELEP